MAPSNIVVAGVTAAPSKARNLSPQQENFARHIVMGYSAAESYRRAYTIKPNTKQSSIWTRASITAADRNVALRIAELKAQAAALAVVTNASMLYEMEANRTIALDTGKLSVAQTASRDRAKLAGVVPKPGLSNPPPPADDAARSINEIARRVAFTLALGRRKKLAAPGA